jgi:ABC-2 type transport system permease protein
MITPSSTEAGPLPSRHGNVHDGLVPQPPNGDRPSRVLGSLQDAAAMSSRGLRHLTRHVDVLIMAVVLPVMILVLFVYVFGGAIAASSDAYLDYVVPGIILLCASFGSATTAVGVCNDVVTGVVDRFRSLPIASSTVIAGHVVASLARNLVAASVVLTVAVAIGFRPRAGVLGWLGAIGLVALFIVAISTVSAALGLVASAPDAANGYTFAFLFLPYVSSAFVPTDTMPSWLHGFAEHQPVTPAIEAVRALLLGTSVGSSWWLAVAWFGGITVVAYALAVVLFRVRAARR